MGEKNRSEAKEKIYPNTKGARRLLGSCNKDSSMGYLLQRTKLLNEALFEKSRRVAYELDNGINFYKVFGRKRIVLPVIHVENGEQAMQNVDIAWKTGCSGVFLINHSISHVDLLEIYKDITTDFPYFWIGINCLDLLPTNVFSVIPESINGVWVDNAMISEKDLEQKNAQNIQFSINRVNWRGLYFGGVAFKYQPEVNNLEFITKQATRFMDVVTTSGPATGQSADVEKIKLMRSYLGKQFPLAIASGITPENVSNYLPFVNAFLVATGISSSSTELNEEKTQLLVDKVRSYGEMK